MHESALFLLGLLVAESSVCHAVRRLHTVPSTLVPRACMYPRAYPTPRCETSHTHARRVDRREKGGWSSACERQLRSTSLLKGVWQIRWGNTDGSLVFCPSFLLFSLLSFFLLFLSLFLIPFHSVSFFRKRWDERERERRGKGRKNCVDVWQRSWTSETNRRVTGIYLNLWERPVAATGRIFLFAD